MAQIKLNNCDSELVIASADIIFTDPPFDMSADKLSKVLGNVDSNHLVLITTMRQLVDLLKLGEWELSFDFVLDAVTPKKSKTIHQPNYTHSTGAYLTRNNVKSIFNRKLRQRSDTFDNNGYWPTVIRAPRERLQEHGMAKNEQAVTDILGSFNAKSVYDPFAGSGTVGLAAIELGMSCELTELCEESYGRLNRTFMFFMRN